MGVITDLYTGSYLYYLILYVTTFATGVGIFVAAVGQVVIAVLTAITTFLGELPTLLYIIIAIVIFFFFWYLWPSIHGFVQNDVFPAINVVLILFYFAWNLAITLWNIAVQVYNPLVPFLGLLICIILSLLLTIINLVMQILGSPAVWDLFHAIIPLIEILLQILLEIAQVFITIDITIFELLLQIAGPIITAVLNGIQVLYPVINWLFNILYYALEPILFVLQAVVNFVEHFLARSLLEFDGGETSRGMRDAPSSDSMQNQAFAAMGTSARKYWNAGSLSNAISQLTTINSYHKLHPAMSWTYYHAMRRPFASQLDSYMRKERPEVMAAMNAVKAQDEKMFSGESLPGTASAPQKRNVLGLFDQTDSPGVDERKQTRRLDPSEEIDGETTESLEDRGYYSNHTSARSEEIPNYLPPEGIDVALYRDEDLSHDEHFDEEYAHDTAKITAAWNKVSSDNLRSDREARTNKKSGGANGIGRRALARFTKKEIAAGITCTTELCGTIGRKMRHPIPKILEANEKAGLHLNHGYRDDTEHKRQVLALSAYIRALKTGSKQVFRDQLHSKKLGNKAYEAFKRLTGFESADQAIVHIKKRWKSPEEFVFDYWPDLSESIPLFKRIKESDPGHISGAHLTHNDFAKRAKGRVVHDKRTGRALLQFSAPLACKQAQCYLLDTSKPILDQYKQIPSQSLCDALQNNDCFVTNPKNLLCLFSIPNSFMLTAVPQITYPVILNNDDACGYRYHLIDRDLGSLSTYLNWAWIANGFIGLIQVFNFITPLTSLLANFLNTYTWLQPFFGWLLLGPGGQPPTVLDIFCFLMYGVTGILILLLIVEIISIIAPMIIDILSAVWTFLSFLISANALFLAAFAAGADHSALTSRDLNTWGRSAIGGLSNSRVQHGPVTPPGKGYRYVPPTGVAGGSSASSIGSSISDAVRARFSNPSKVERALDSVIAQKEADFYNPPTESSTAGGDIESGTLPRTASAPATATRVKFVGSQESGGVFDDDSNTEFENDITGDSRVKELRRQYEQENAHQERLHENSLSEIDAQLLARYEQMMSAAVKRFGGTPSFRMSYSELQRYETVTWRALFIKPYQLTVAWLSQMDAYRKQKEHNRKLGKEIHRERKPAFSVQFSV